MRSATMIASVKRHFCQGLTLPLLLLYLACSSNIELLHLFVHGHDIAVAHSAEQEQDPCHEQIYHNDAEKGCDHRSHLIVTDTCSMCDLAYHGDQVILKTIGFKPVIPFQEEHHSLYKTNPDSYQDVLSPSRAPPALT